MIPIIFFLDTKQNFSSQEKKRIRRIVLTVFKKTTKTFKGSQKVIITFYRFGKANHGFTRAKDWIDVTVKTGKIDFVDLEGMLYHECHHIIRGYCGYLERRRHYLLDTLFSEGLATAYEIENQPRTRITTHDKYNKRLVKAWLPKIKPELFSSKYNYNSWFHGQGKPLQIGYRLGKYLVDEIMKNNPDLNYADLATLEARTLLRLSKVRI